jgi:hypothetical protein
LSFSAGSGAYNSSTGVITIPTNNNQITNGAGYITAETDTLQSVILRNGTTNTGFTISNSNNTYTSPGSTNVPFIYMYNTGTTSTSNAVLSLRTNSATGGDPILSFDIGEVTGWSMGIDNSDSDKFKIANDWASLDTNTRFSMSLDGTAVFVGNLSAANLSGTNTGNVTIGTANGLSLSGQALSLGLASGSANGALSSTDWTTFNNKQNALTNPVTGTGTTNYLPKFTGASTIGNSNLINDASGNLGLGVTPSAWTLFSGVLELNGGPAIGGFANTTYFLQNSNFDSGFKYKTTGTAGRYELGGQHSWWIAPSGTAGNAITFTQAMTLFSSGNLAIGPTTDAGYKLDVNGTGRFSDTTDIIANNSTAINLVLRGRALDSIGQMELWNNAKSVRYGYIAAESINMSISTTQSIPLILGTNTTPRLTINGSTGAATFSSSVTANGGLNATGYTNSSGANYLEIGSGSDFYAINAINRSSGFYNFPFFIDGQKLILNSGSGGNVLIGQTLDLGFKLLVSGTGCFTSTLLVAAGNNGGRLRVGNITNAYAIAFEKWNSSLTLGGFFQNSGSSGEMILVDTNGSQNVLISSSGNSYWNAPSARFSIGTTVNTTDLFRVNGNTFTNTLMTWNPQNDNRSGVEWRFGSATIGTDIPNRRLRVSVGGMEYYIAAVEV